MIKSQAERHRAYGYLRSYGNLQTRLSSNPTATNRSRCNIKYQARITLKHRITAVTDTEIAVELVIRANRPANQVSVFNLSLINTRGVSLNSITSNCGQFPVINRENVSDDFCENGRVVAGGSLAPNVNHTIRYSVTPANAMLYSDQILITGNQVESRESTVETLFKPSSRIIATRSGHDTDHVYLDTQQFGKGHVVENSRRLRLVTDTWSAKPRTNDVYTRFEFSYDSDTWHLAEIIGICGDGSRITLSRPDAVRVAASVACPLGREFDSGVSTSRKRHNFAIRQIAFLIVKSRDCDAVEHTNAHDTLTQPVRLNRDNTEPSVETSLSDTASERSRADPVGDVDSDASAVASRESAGETPSLFDRIQEMVIAQLPNDYHVDWVQAQLDLEVLIGMLDNVCDLLDRPDVLFPDATLRTAVSDFFDTCMASPVTVLTDHNYKLVEMPMTNKTVVLGYGIVFEFDGQNLVVVAFSDHFAQSENGIIPLNYLTDATQRLDQAKVVPFKTPFEQLLKLFRHTHDEIEKFRDQL